MRQRSRDVRQAAVLFLASPRTCGSSARGLPPAPWLGCTVFATSCSMFPPEQLLPSGLHPPTVNGQRLMVNAPCHSQFRSFAPLHAQWYLPQPALCVNSTSYLATHRKTACLPLLGFSVPVPTRIPSHSQTVHLMRPDAPCFHHLNGSKAPSPPTTPATPASTQPKSNKNGCVSPALVPVLTSGRHLRPRLFLRDHAGVQEVIAHLLFTALPMTAGSHLRPRLLLRPRRAGGLRARLPHGAGAARQRTHAAEEAAAAGGAAVGGTLRAVRGPGIVGAPGGATGVGSTGWGGGGGRGRRRRGAATGGGRGRGSRCSRGWG